VRAPEYHRTQIICIPILRRYIYLLISALCQETWQSVGLLFSQPRYGQVLPIRRGSGIVRACPTWLDAMVRRQAKLKAQELLPLHFDLQQAQSQSYALEWAEQMFKLPPDGEVFRYQSLVSAGSALRGVTM
jgi:hypothetical protein